ncbi:MAG: hypothetical protein JO251_03360 [Verrucomicrobia bacterium]|nr:hypothetical protein [Verrucomicrobiota bacterium]
MKTMLLFNSCSLLSVRSIVQKFLAFFRFTEADAAVLLSAYGLHGLELDRQRNNHPNEPKEASGGMEALSHCKRATEPPAPIPIGVHPISFGRTELFPMWKRSVKPGHRRGTTNLMTPRRRPATATSHGRYLDNSSGSRNKKRRACKILSSNSLN